jgi:hypothetical protein
MILKEEEIHSELFWMLLFLIKLNNLKIILLKLKLLMKP